MSDIALVIVQEGEELSFDLAMNGPDLAMDDTLQTPTSVSLFSDALASADATIPDGTGDRRGYWGDLPLEDQGDTAQPDYMGSLLWLLNRSKVLPTTAAEAQGYGVSALQWMIEDGVAQSVTFDATFLSLGTMQLTGNIARLSSAGSVINHQFDYIWNPTLAP